MRWKEITREISGLLMSLFGVFLFVSLLTFSATDPPSPLVVSFERGIQNSGGHVGAYFSFYLFRYLGIFASYVLSILLFLWGGLLFVKKPVTDGWLKMFAATLFIISISTIERLFVPQSLFSTRLTGGYYGTFFATVLLRYLGATGAYLTVISLLAVSFILSTNLLLHDILKSSIVWAKKQVTKTELFQTKKEVPIPVKPVAIDTPRVEVVKSAPVKRKKADKEEEHPEGDKERPCQKNGYVLPPLSLLNPPTPLSSVDDKELQNIAITLEQALASFKINAKVVGMQHGPTVTQYEIALAPGVTVNSVCIRETDISVALGASGVRIVAPIPGKNTIGIEVPNREKSEVSLRGLIESPEFREKKYIIPLFLSRNTSGSPVISDLTKMPHLLVAGATGSGKSVCLNSIIMSILFTKSPEEVKLILIDPKMVEFGAFADIPHLYHPVVTEMRKAAGVLDWAMRKMDERYKILSTVGVKNIQEFNRLGESGVAERVRELSEEERKKIPNLLPYIVIMIDELSDLLLVARKEVEMSIVRLAQKSRAVGIHLVVATQRPCVDVISGHIKGNMPSRIAFRVASQVDSRTILDQNGAESLLGSGDMLYLQQGAQSLIRAQGAFVSSAEIDRTVSYLRNKKKPEFNEELLAWQPEQEMAEGVSAGEGEQGGRDEEYYEAVKVILTEGRGSVSLLQRKLGLGYGRAARYIDFMEADGILGPSEGSKPRQVLISLDAWLAKTSSQVQV